jgi:peroxiredoxin
MISEGTKAPEFELPGFVDGEKKTMDLTNTIADDRAILLLFYPFDFSPVCTTELCAIRDAEWFEFTSDLDVWAVSGDSTYAHQEFADKHNLTFPLLSDYHGATAADFGIRYNSWEGHSCVPKRAVFLIDPHRTVRYAWAAEEAYTKPDFAPVKAALDELSTLDNASVPNDLELQIDYSEG